MEVLALLAGAAALDVVHADGDGVVAGVDHGAVARVGEAAVGLPAGAVAPLELAAHLRAGESGGGDKRQRRMRRCGLVRERGTDTDCEHSRGEDRETHRDTQTVSFQNGQRNEQIDCSDNFQKGTYFSSRIF